MSRMTSAGRRIYLGGWWARWREFLNRLAASIPLLLIAGLLTTGCTYEKGTRRVLAQDGYTQIEMTGYGWFKCGKDDSFATAFKAKNLAGRTVTGTVCGGWMKGYTIRFD